MVGTRKEKDEAEYAYVSLIFHTIRVRSIAHFGLYLLKVTRQI